MDSMYTVPILELKQGDSDWVLKLHANTSTFKFAQLC